MSRGNYTRIDKRQFPDQSTWFDTMKLRDIVGDRPALGALYICLTFVLSLSVFGCTKDLTHQQTVSDSPTQHRTTEQYAKGDSVEIPETGISIEFGKLYLWRDWQPTVNNPGPDGGSPLYVSFNFVLTNSSESSQQIAWVGYVQDGEQTLYPLHFTDRAQTPLYSLTLDSGNVLEVDLVAHNGPYLTIGSKASIHMSFTVDNKRHAELNTTSVVVNQTM